jgi:hypothetical protein
LLEGYRLVVQGHEPGHHGRRGKGFRSVFSKYTPSIAASFCGLKEHEPNQSKAFAAIKRFGESGTEGCSHPVALATTYCLLSNCRGISTDTKTVPLK